MFCIPEAEEINLLTVKDKIDFDKIINTKKFTVKDSTLTYRQANSMGEDNMLPEEKNRGQGWRKFSLKELIYIELVLELKKFGLKHSQLKEVWNSFFLNQDQVDGNSRWFSSISDDVIAYVMGHIDIILTITEDGEISYLHPTFFTTFYPKEKPFVFVSMSDLVNRICRRIGKPEFPPKANLFSLNHVLTTKEEKTINILRSGNYKNVKLTIKEGQVDLIHAEKYINEDGANSVESLISRINTGKYQKISLTQRDGKIVNISQEDTIKV